MNQNELTSVVLAQKGSHFYIEADMFIACGGITNNTARVYTPVLNDETHQVELPLVLLAGSRRYWALKRTLWTLGCNLMKGYKILKIFRVNKQPWISYNYCVCVDYEEWMSEARLTLFIEN